MGVCTYMYPNLEGPSSLRMMVQSIAFTTQRMGFETHMATPLIAFTFANLVSAYFPLGHTETSHPKQNQDMILHW